MSTLASAQKRPIWALPVVVLAVIAILIAGYVGIHGLTQNPVGATDSAGLTTLTGEFEPYGCGAGCNEGYIQAGAQSVFVILPATCAAPSPGGTVVVVGRLDSTQGKATYRADGCARAA